MLRLISQPLVTLLSQLPNPELHAMAQAPPLHDAVPFVPLHTVPHAPQLLVLVLVLVSQPLLALPSQLPNPVLQELNAHEPVAHEVVALVRLHTVPHAPQLLVVLRFVSQPLFALPSQFAKPAAHEGTQSPLVHAVVPLAFEHAMPQPPQFDVVVTAVSQPVAVLLSQLANPATQPPIWQVPLLHTAAALA